MITGEALADRLRGALAGAGPVEVERVDLVGHVCAAVARHVVAQSELVGTPDLALAPQCRAPIEGSLIRRVRAVLAGTLLSEFEVHRAQRFDPIGQLSTMNDRSQAAGHVDDFVRWLADGGIDELLEHHALLPDVLCRTIEDWERATGELLGRLAGDWDRIVQHFAAYPAERGVDRVALDLGDPHGGGRTVGAVWLDDGTGLVYKPRDLTSDVVWCDVVDWVNDRAGDRWLRAPTVLTRGDYGWVEHIGPEPCANAQDVATFYRRAGRLLCLAHLLGIGDAHHENLVAAGAEPVLVDLETFAASQPEPLGRTGVDAARAYLARSVNGLGFLPRRRLVGDGWVDTASFGTGLGPGELVATHLGAELLPNDVRVTLSVGDNVPVLDGVARGADEYVETICSGFEDALALLRRYGHELVDDDGPLAPLRSADARVLVRQTHDYGAALAAANRPGSLRDRERRDSILTPPPLSWLDDHDLAGAISDAESAALRRGDVPLFRMRVDSTELTAPATVAGRAVPRYEPGLAGVRRRLGELVGGRADGHLREVRWAFQGRRSAPGERPPMAPAWTDGGPADDGELLNEALRIGWQVRESAVWGADGSCAWIVPAAPFADVPYGLTVTTASLYAGAAGVGMFLAALSIASGDESFRPVALGAFRSVIDQLGDVPQTSCGGIAGAAAAFYALTEASVMLADDDLLEAALDGAAGLSTSAVADRDVEIDVIGGRAGLCLALEVLYRRTGSAAVKAQLEEVALGLARLGTGAPKRWPNASGIALTGFGHGAGGIAHALMAAATLTECTELADAAAEAVAYEASEFDESIGNWRDLRVDGFPRGMVAWCNGAAGIGLGRLPWLGTLPGAERDVRRAVDLVREYPPGAMQHLCCGDAGRIEFLHEAGRMLGEPDLAALARRRARWLIERAAASGGRYVLEAGDRDGSEPNPTLMRGNAGIGYTFLRLIDPERIPQLLTLRPAESPVAT